MAECFFCGHKFKGDKCDLCGTEYTWHQLLHAKERKEQQALADAGDVKAALRMGQYLHNQSKYCECLPYLQMAADADEADAQALLGQMYYCGQGVAQDIEESIKWHAMAARNGNGNSMFDMGLFYATGEGVSQDDKIAVSYFEKGAAIGNAKSLSALGKCYSTGRGVDVDKNAGILLFRMAAEAGDYDCAGFLEYLKKKGELPEIDDAEEQRIKAKLGFSEPQVTIELLEIDSDEKPEASPKETEHPSEQQDATVEELMPKAIDGDPIAQYNLGICYYNGNSVIQNVEEAVKWFKKSADQGNPYAQFNLGICYHDGQGVKENKREALKWIKMSAEQGLSNAQSYLGCCCLNGDGIKKDKHAAISWFKKAADQGDPNGQFNLAMCYGRGDGVYPDSNKGLEWLRLAAIQGHQGAIQMLNAVEQGQ